MLLHTVMYTQTAAWAVQPWQGKEKNSPSGLCLLVASITRPWIWPFKIIVAHRQTRDYNFDRATVFVFLVAHARGCFQSYPDKPVCETWRLVKKNVCSACMLKEEKKIDYLLKVGIGWMLYIVHGVGVQPKKPHHTPILGGCMGQAVVHHWPRLTVFKNYQIHFLRS